MPHRRHLTGLVLLAAASGCSELGLVRYGDTLPPTAPMPPGLAEVVNEAIAAGSPEPAPARAAAPASEEAPVPLPVAPAALTPRAASAPAVASVAPPAPVPAGAGAAAAAATPTPAPAPVIPPQRLAAPGGNAIASPTPQPAPRDPTLLRAAAPAPTEPAPSLAPLDPEPASPPAAIPVPAPVPAAATVAPAPLPVAPAASPLAPASTATPIPQLMPVPAPAVAPAPEPPHDTAMTRAASVVTPAPTAPAPVAPRTLAGPAAVAPDRVQTPMAPEPLPAGDDVLDEVIDEPIDVAVAPEPARPAPEPSRTTSRTIAQVGSDVVTLSDLTNAVKARLAVTPGGQRPSRRQIISLARSTLQTLIEQTLVRQDALAALGGPEAVRARIEQIDRRWIEQEVPRLIAREGVADLEGLQRKLGSRGQSVALLGETYRYRVLAADLMRRQGLAGAGYEAYLERLRERYPITSVMTPREIAAAAGDPRSQKGQPATRPGRGSVGP